MLDDTIAGVATAVGSSGIGIVRVSGENAISIVNEIFLPKKGVDLGDTGNFRIRYGHIVDAEQLVIDEVLVSVMREPHSFTGEDVVEINCHGGIVAVRSVLELVLRKGARMAEPGEFSKRAFLNGRIDLAQAESIIDVINAKTTRSLNVAVNQLGGKLSGEVSALRKELLGLLAHIEAFVDFPEEDIEVITNEKIKEKGFGVLERIEKLIRTAETGILLKEGIKTIIVGKPNVGKSSLLNALVRENRAIVTEIPGTTRDIIEEGINLNGIPLVLVDTAGIRETTDIVEKIGVEKTKEKFAEADLILLVVDAGTGLTQEDWEIISLLEGKKYWVIVNKTDLKVGNDLNQYRDAFSGHELIEMSLSQGVGIETLESKMTDMFFSGNVENRNDEILVANVRHREALEKAAGFLREAMDGAMGGISLDCVGIDLRSAWEVLGEIIGETVSEDLIDRIFSEFCLGK